MYEYKQYVFYASSQMRVQSYQPLKSFSRCSRSFDTQLFKDLKKNKFLLLIMSGKSVITLKEKLQFILKMQHVKVFLKLGLG